MVPTTVCHGGLGVSILAPVLCEEFLLVGSGLDAEAGILTTQVLN